MYTPHPVSPNSNPLYHLGYLSQLRNQHCHIAINQCLILFRSHRSVTPTLLSCARLLSWDRHHVIFSCFHRLLWFGSGSVALLVFHAFDSFEEHCHVFCRKCFSLGFSDAFSSLGWWVSGPRTSSSPPVGVRTVHVTSHE